MITEPQITELLDVTEEYPIRVVAINDGVLLSRASAKRQRLPARDNAVFEDRNLSKHHAFLQLEGDYLRIVDGGSVYGSCVFTSTGHEFINDGGFAKVDISKTPRIILGCVVKDMDAPALTNCKLHWFIVISKGQLIMMKLNSSKIYEGLDPTILLLDELPVRLEYTATKTTLIEKPYSQQSIIPTVLLGILTGSFLTFMSLSIYGYLVRTQT